MNLAISNIAWQIHEEAAIANLLQELDIKGVEIAPTKIWQQPLSASNEEIASYRKFWGDRNIQIVAMQALLFGKPDLTIFADAESRLATFIYLTGIVQLASKLGVKVLVFGSPKNRLIGNLNPQQVDEIALPFFHKLGEFAAKYDATFCIEPNPTIYGCDFITNSQSGKELVLKTNSSGFGLHLDAAGMTLSQEAIIPALQNCIDNLCHFHISEANLAPVGRGEIDHQTFANTLQTLNYQNWVSVEMKAENSDSNISNVSQALQTAIKYYAG